MMLTLLLLSASATAADPPEAPGLSGTWVLADDWESVQKRHAQAVDTAVAQLSWAFRPVARPLLLKSVWSCGELEVGLSEAEFEARCDEKDPFVMDRGTPKKQITGDDGKPYDVALIVEGERVAVRFEGAQGGQENRYQFDDGSLVVTRQMFSPQLPEPVSWTVRYKRKAE